MLTLDGLTNSVNLLSGTLSLPLPLVQVPGLNGIGIEVTLQYSSTVQTNAETWNLDASTGTLGLGWSLQTQYILADNQQAGTATSTNYYLIRGGAMTQLVQTGSTGTVDSYAPVNYSFLRISHDRSDESWTLINEDGTIQVFGGGYSGTNGNPPASTGNSIVWGVQWGNWVGSSALTTGQSNSPVVWKLSALKSTWGDQVSFVYTQFSDDTIAVGTGGLCYTRASYPASITGPDGRTVVFTYGEKLYDTSSATGQREYQPPLTGPLNTPNAAQNRYETRFLQSLAVTNSDGSTATQFNFSFDVMGSGDLAKRYLTGISQVNPLGTAQSGLSFTYLYTDTQNQPLGLLQSVTTPEGGTATFDYQLIQPQYGSRDQSILKTYTKPRLWFDAGYAVTLWYDSATQTALPFAYRWEGQWTETQFGSISLGGDYDALQVRTERGYFAILRPEYKAGPNVMPPMLSVYKLDGTQPTAWASTAYTLSGYQLGETLLLLCGSSFIAVLGKTTGLLQRFSWNGSQWQQQPNIYLTPGGGNGKFAAAAHHNYLITAACDSSSAPQTATVQMFYLDAMSVWQNGYSGTVATTASSAADLDLFAASSYAILRVKNTSSGSSFGYVALQWPMDFSQVTASTLTADTSDGLDPQIRGALVGIGPLLYRFTGSTWTSLDLGAAQFKYPSQTSAAPVCSYGADKVMRRVSQGSKGNAYDIAQYFPSTDTWQVDAFNGGALPSLTGSTWGGLPNIVLQSMAPISYALVANLVYYNMPDGSWSNVGTIPTTATADSVQLIGNNYLAYQNSGNAVVVPLQNGTLASTITLNNQSLFTDNSIGKVLVGPNSFATYTGTFDTPTGLTLHAIINNGATGPVQNHAVTSVSLNNGFDVNTTAFAYDATTAVADSAGQMSLFNKVTVSGGNPTAGSNPVGSTMVYMFNGCPSSAASLPFPTDPATTNADDCYRLLTGLSYYTASYDQAGSLVASQTSYWYVTTMPLANVATSFYGRMRRSDSVVDGITTSRYFSYSTTTGMVTQSQYANVNGAGETETICESYIRTADAYPALATANLLSEIVQTTQSVQIGQRIQYTGVSVTTWMDWGDNKWAPNKTYAATSNTNRFDFTNWSGQGEPPPMSWLRTGQTEERSANGQILVGGSPEGILTSSLYDSAGIRKVATFTNADITQDEAGYCGFESYEDLGAWTISGSAAIDTTDSHTGAASLRLPAPNAENTASLSRAFIPGQTNCTYMLSFWIKTSAGFAADGGQATISMTVSQASGSGTGQIWTFTVADTQGQWAYVCSPALDPSTVTGAAKLTLLASNSKQSAYYNLDDVRFSPVASAFSAVVYRVPNYAVTAMLGPNNETTRYALDQFMRPIALIGPVENPVSLAFGYNAIRTGGALSVPQNLNAVGTLQARMGGYYERFMAGWNVNWTTSGPNWTATGGILSYTGTGQSTCAWNGWQQQQNLGVRVQVAAPGGGQPTATIGLSIGNQTIAWQPSQSQGTWLLNAIPVVNHTAVPYTSAKDWLLTFVDGRLLFWADGRLIIDTVPPVAAAGTITLSAQGPSAFTEAVIFFEPTIDMSYLDGGGNARQSQTMNGQTSVVVGATLYDSLSRPSIAVKPVTANTSAAMFGYRSDLVTNGSPTAAASVWTTGQAQGSINTYYPYDGSYPFSRSCFEASPLARQVISGLPGADFATGSGFATTTAYGSDSTQNYATTTLTDGDGHVTVSIQDRAGKIISRQTGPSSGSTTYALTQFSYQYSDQGTQVTITPPNYATPPAGSGTAQGYAVVQQYDFLQHMVSQTSTDQGLNQYIYDLAGRVRFSLNPLGRGAGAGGTDRIDYIGYDALGRPTQVGEFDYAWYRLPSFILGNGYIPPTPLTVRRAFTYYPAGSVSTNLLQQVVSTGPETVPSVVTESYIYDTSGRISQTGITASAYDTGNGGAHTVTYTYDNLGNVLTLTSSDASTVVYGYNRRGLISTIGTVTAPSIYASYSYNADGSINTESLGYSGSSGGNSTFSYNSPGWLSKINYKYFNQSLSYNSSQGYQGASYHSGLISSESSRQNWNNAPPSYTYQMAYDDLCRLSVAANTSSTSEGLGTSGGIQYDASGNILALNRGNNNLTYSYLKTGQNLATDQVGTIKGALSYTYTYDAAGNITSDGNMVSSLVQDPLISRPVSIALQGSGLYQSLAFTYNATGQRTTKTITAQGGSQSVQLYVRGQGSPSVVELVKAADGSVTTTAYIHGPTGRVAMVQGGTIFYFVKDHLGSTRTVFDGQGNIRASFDYMPFGTLIQSGGSTPGLTFYRYAGLEFDSFTGNATDGYGLYNCNARLYDPVSARFYGPDPQFSPGSPYMYCADNPVSLTDPDGEWFIIAMALLGATAGGVAGFFLGRQKGASGWALAGYVAGGALVGAAAGATGAYIGAAAAGAASGWGWSAGAAGMFGGIVGEGAAGVIQGVGMTVVSGDYDNIGSNVLSSTVAGMVGGAVGGLALSSASTGIRAAGVLGGGFAAGAVGSAIDGGNMSDIMLNGLVGAAISGVSYAATPKISTAMARRFSLHPDTVANRWDHITRHLEAPVGNRLVPRYQNGPAHAQARANVQAFVNETLRNPIRVSFNYELNPLNQRFRNQPELIYWTRRAPIAGGQPVDIVFRVALRTQGGLQAGQISTGVVPTPIQAQNLRLSGPLPFLWLVDFDFT